MNTLTTIGLFILAMIIGAFLGYLIIRIYMKYKLKKMGKDAVDKIMNQDKVFFNDGEEIDIKKIIESQLAKNGHIENN